MRLELEVSWSVCEWAWRIAGTTTRSSGSFPRRSVLPEFLLLLVLDGGGSATRGSGRQNAFLDVQTGLIEFCESLPLAHVGRSLTLSRLVGLLVRLQMALIQTILLSPVSHAGLRTRGRCQSRVRSRDGLPQIWPSGDRISTIRRPITT